MCCFPCLPARFFLIYDYYDFSMPALSGKVFYHMFFQGLFRPAWLIPAFCQTCISVSLLPVLFFLLVLVCPCPFAGLLPDLHFCQTCISASLLPAMLFCQSLPEEARLRGEEKEYSGISVFFRCRPVFCRRTRGIRCRRRIRSTRRWRRGRKAPFPL